YTDRIRRDDRLFTNTIWALYPDTAGLTEEGLEAEKQAWLLRLKEDGVYMIEALQPSQRHAVTKKQRQQRIREAMPRLVERVPQLAANSRENVLIKSFLS